jgi:cell division protein FtsB
MRTADRREWTWVVSVLFVSLAGCQPQISQEVQAQLATLDTLTAQRDSLFHEVADNARLLNELNADLDKVEGLRAPDTAAGESPLSAQRDGLRTKVQQVTARLAEAEKRVASTRAQLARARREADTLQERVTSLEQMVAGFEEMLEGQRTTIATLTERVTVLEAENLALRDTVSNLAARQNKAYYVVGTKDELLERGIIVKEGGARVLFIFGKAGQTLQPARDLDPSAFTVINMREVTEIPLPDSTAEYVIASRQDLNYLATPPMENGKVRGSVRIGAPEQFWMPSRFLIVVRT